MDKKIRKRDIVLKALALLVAIGLWVYVSYVESPEIEVKYYNIPLTYKNEDSLAAAQLIRDTDNETQTITIKVRGKRSKLFSLSGHDITAKVDLSGITYAATHSLPVTVTFPVDGFTVVDKKPYTIPVKIERAVTKDLPVSIDVVGEPDSSCEVTNQTLPAETVKVTGPESVMNKAKSCVATVNIDGLAEEKAVPAEIKIELADGTFLKDDSKISFPDGEVTVLVEMKKTVEIPIKPTIDNIASVSIKNTTVTPDKIEVSGDYKDISKMGGFIGTEKIILDGGSGTRTFDVYLDIPEGIEVTDKNTIVTVELEIENKGSEGDE